MKYTREHLSRRRKKRTRKSLKLITKGAKKAVVQENRE
jgi:hypothetical protein